MNWQPTISIKNLQLRAKILCKIRQFFAERNILEVETPLLCKTTATDPYIESFCVEKYQRYLQTSPEFAMKRLLAAGSGSIYQICKAFRIDEAGRHHNPEFTILEWYRLGFNHHQLMEEMDEFLQYILRTGPAKKFSYQELFINYLSIDPHTVTLSTLAQTALNNNLDFSHLNNITRDDWLRLLLTHSIEPKLGFDQPCFVYDFPASQAALAQIRSEDPPVGERFEVYIQGIELANGYHELSNASEQRQRFLNDIKQRQDENYANVPLDEKLLAALEHGLPACAGVALGIDRLIMLAICAKSITDVIGFPWHNS